MTTQQIIAGSVIVAMGAGAMYFGSRQLKKAKLIEETPQSKVRSMAMGLVEVHGHVDPIETIKTPLSQTDCVYYRYKIEEYVRETRTNSKGQTRTTHKWRTIQDYHKETPFNAQDDTGSVKVIPERAEFEVNPKKRFVQKAGLMGGINLMLDAFKRWNDKDYQPIDIAKWGLREVAPEGFSGHANVGDRRFTEWYILPTEPLFVLGTAQHDAENNVFLARGENEKTFIISDTSEKEVVGKYKKSGWLLVGIGVLVVLLGAWFILQSIGLFGA